MKISVISDNNNDYLSLPDKIPDPTICYTNEAYVYNKFLFIPSQAKNFYQYNELSLSFIGDNSEKIISRLKTSNYEIINDICLFAHHPCSDNYSHYLLQCLGAMLLAKSQSILSDKITIITPQDKTFHRETLQIYNLDDYKLKQLKENILYKFNRLFYSNLYYNQTFLGSKPFSIAFFDLFQEKVNCYEASNSEYIYITRINNQKRKILNESEVITFFKNHGFKIIDFDSISVIDQIKYIRNSKIICAAHGASGANLIYKNLDEFKFVEIFGNRFVNWHLYIANSKLCNYSAIKCNSIDKSIESNFEVNIKNLQRSLDETCHQFTRKQSDCNIISTEFEKLIYDTANNHFNSALNGKKIFSLITYHKKIVTVNTEYTKLIQQTLSSSSIPSLELNDLSYLFNNIYINNSIRAFIFNKLLYLYSPKIYKFVSKIDENNNVEYSYIPTGYKFKQNYINNISIVIDNKFLSARKDGTFQFKCYNGAWEHFLLI